VFDALAPMIWGDVRSESFAEEALHRARRRLGERLRMLVAETVADPSDVDAELRHLTDAISGPSSPV
jgi:hypothetical protein